VIVRGVIRGRYLAVTVLRVCAIPAKSTSASSSTTPLHRPVPGYEKMQQQDALWSLICGSIAALATRMTGLLVVCQIQLMIQANALYDLTFIKLRSAHRLVI
jgi:hypothetical protein